MSMMYFNFMRLGVYSTTLIWQCSNTIGYKVIDFYEINVGKQYVCDVDAFLRGKDVEDYSELALARDLWAGYCAGEAKLTNNDEELAYWSKQQNLLTSSTDVLANHPTLVHFIGDVLEQCQGIDIFIIFASYVQAYDASFYFAFTAPSAFVRIAGRGTDHL